MSSFGLLAASLIQHMRGDEDGNNCRDGEQEEDPTPAKKVGDDAANDQTAHGADRGHGGQQRHGTRATWCGRIEAGDEGEGGGDGGGLTQSLQRPGGRSDRHERGLPASCRSRTNSAPAFQVDHGQLGRSQAAKAPEIGPNGARSR